MELLVVEFLVLVCLVPLEDGVEDGAVLLHRGRVHGVLGQLTGVGQGLDLEVLDVVE